MKCKIVTVLLFYCLLGTANAQEASWQDLVSRKQYAAVIAQANSLTPADSSNYTVMNTIAQAYEGILRYREAYAYYQHCLSLDTANVDALNALARTATNLGRAKEAERYFHRVLETDSLNFYANYQLARLYYQMGEYIKAIEKYEKLQEQDPDNPSLWSNLGDCYTRLEILPGAAFAYLQAYSHNRENASLANVLINTMYHIGSDYTPEALAICDTALRYSPNNRLLLRCKATGLYQTKEFTLADSLYTVLLANGDSSYLTLKYAGASKYYAGLYLPAVDLLKMAYEHDTTSVEICLLLASALSKTYDRKQALILLDKAERALQPNPFLRNQLLAFKAETYKRERRKKESARLYYQAWQENPTHLNFLGEIAEMYSVTDVSRYENAENRQRGLFIHMLYINEILKTKIDTKTLAFNRILLQSFYEDLFFRNLSEETIIAPDGKKSTITVVDLRNLINRLPEESEQTLEIRAIAAKRDGKSDEVARLFYQVWKIQSTRVELAREVYFQYNCADISSCKTAEELQRTVFAQVFFIREMINNQLSLDNLDLAQAFFLSLYDDLSRRGLNAQDMLAPDGQKSTLLVTELKSLIDHLPEMSATTKEMLEMEAKVNKLKK